MKKILVTGASGFVGSRFCSHYKYKGAIRTVSLQQSAVEAIDFKGVKCILHLAGIAHRMEKTPDALYHDVNHKLSYNLAKKAKEAGVEHFVYMSTIKVYGDHKESLAPDITCEPDDAYGESKLLGEQAIQSLASEDFTISIIRPPLIYGPGVKGNMKKLIALIGKCKVLPFGRIYNQRSIVGIDNLLSLITLLLEKRPSGVFLVQDAQPLSTTQLIEMIGKAQGKPIKLLAIPEILRSLMKMLMPEMYKRLFGSLVVDDSQTRSQLGYSPSVSTVKGIEAMVNNS